MFHEVQLDQYRSNKIDAMATAIGPTTNTHHIHQFDVTLYREKGTLDVAVTEMTHATARTRLSCCKVAEAAVFRALENRGYIR
tara:strand:+ start:165 stop:413 length:249 start_codon:yes stop_codon:yes gene_type:complete